MNLKEMFDSEENEIESSSSYEPSDLGLRKFKPSKKKIQFMRGYSDDGELIFDPFDPKNKNDDGSKPINYNKKFSKEMKQHHKLIRQQAMYVDQLEKLFRQTTGLGTANPRQLTKTDVELASVLSQARGQLLQMINGVSSLKKTIADLQLKQYAKLATGNTDGETSMMTQDMKGSSILQQILAEDVSTLASSNNASASSLPDLNTLDNDDSLVSVDVRNENRNIQLAIVHDTETSENIPVALNEAGEVVHDYNIPSYMNDVDVFLTEGVARSKLGQTFPLIVK